jgi:RNA polymerase sigma-70 factor (ECF subfamily)
VNNSSDIVTALRNDDEKTIESLFRSHYDPMCNYAFTILKDKDDSEEVVQQVFIHLWERRHLMEINTSIQSYLFRSVRNACLNRIKHAKVRSVYAEEISAIAQNSEPADQISTQKELQKQIHSAIDSLPEQCRLVFKLSRFEELKYSEIAEQLGISVKTVENHMGKALRIMREKLSDYLVIFYAMLIYYL